MELKLNLYIKTTWYRWLIVLAVLAVFLWLGHLKNWQLPALLSFK